MECGTVDYVSVFDNDKFFISCLFNLFGYDIIYLWIHIKYLMKHMSYLCNKFLMEFNLFMQVNFMKELETSFWDFVQKLFEKIIIWSLCHRTDIYSPFIIYYVF